MIATVFEKIQIDRGLRYALPKFKNSYVEVGPDLQSDGTLMAISVSISDLLGDLADVLDPQTLPDRNLVISHSLEKTTTEKTQGFYSC